MAAAEAFQVAGDDVLDALELGRRRGDRLELEDAVRRAQLAAAERERDPAAPVVERAVINLLEVMGGRTTLVRLYEQWQAQWSFSGMSLWSSALYWLGVSLEMAGEGVESLPTDERNLAWRAAELMAEHVGRAPDVAISIEKSIPVAGGMAGGSADAAAAQRHAARLQRSLLHVGDGPDKLPSADLLKQGLRPANGDDRRGPIAAALETG